LSFKKYIHPHILHSLGQTERVLKTEIIMVKPMPDDVKACLGELSPSQQVTLKGYIGTLRAEIKDLEEQLRTSQDPDPHAHYHGHEKCTADHGHGHDHHVEDHGHKHGQ
jgi:hypothetical protein